MELIVCQVVFVFLSLCRSCGFFCLNVYPDCMVSALLHTCYPSPISPGFSSEHSLSYYLIKHPRDALEVIGFGTRGKGHRVEFVCVCAWISLGSGCLCVCVCVHVHVCVYVWVCSFLHLCVLCLCCCWFAVNHCVFRKLCGWVRHGGRGFVRGVLKSDMRHINFIVLKEIYVILPNFLPFIINLSFMNKILCFAFLLEPEIQAMTYLLWSCISLVKNNKCCLCDLIEGFFYESSILLG